MTYKQILDMVCKDGIDPSQRADAELWVQSAHSAIWDSEEWTFKYAQAPITFTNGQQIVAAADAPSDLHSVFALYDAHGEPLTPFKDVRQFFDRYNAYVFPITSAYPEAYTVLDGQIFVGPKGNGSVGIIVYEKTKPALVNDTDTTGLPDGYDLALVYGAKARGYLLVNNPLWVDQDAAFNAEIAALEQGWLDTLLETGEQVGAYRPGMGYPWR